MLHSKIEHNCNNFKRENFIHDTKWTTVRVPMAPNSSVSGTHKLLSNTTASWNNYTHTQVIICIGRKLYHTSASSRMYWYYWWHHWGQQVSSTCGSCPASEFWWPRIWATGFLSRPKIIIAFNILQITITDSSVFITTGYRLDGWCLTPGRGNIFLYFTASSHLYLYLYLYFLFKFLCDIPN